MHILLIDTDTEVVSRARGLVDKTNHTITHISRLFHLRNVNLNDIDMIVAEYDLEDYNVIPLLRQIFSTNPKIPCMIWTRVSEQRIYITSEMVGAARHISVYSKATAPFASVLHEIENFDA